jgi:DNA adenine methylase
VSSENYNRAPFPWFGGKSKAAKLIWSRFGSDCGNYVEPFMGSAAVYLNRPAEFSGWATLNDLDGLIVNFWRSVSRYPDETAAAASQPVFECDLHARHLKLVNGKAALAERLMAEPDHCDPLLAGWWAWGACVWIGGGWCAGDGPWHAETDAEGVPVFTLGNGGKGVNRKLPHLGNGGRGECSAMLERATEWFNALRDGFRGARIACGDWERICSVGSMTRNGICAVLLDPPYSQTGAVYANDSSTVAHEVRAWCVANGQNPLLRIALCGHDTEHNELEGMGWSVETWDKAGGYQGADDRERIWFSPACLKPVRAQGELFA